MPIYEFDCEACGRRTEAIQRVGEKPLKICPHCGGKLKKAFSVPAIQFKGSGWYVTDYAGSKGEQKRKEAAADTKEGSAESKDSTEEKREKGEKAEKAEKKESEKKSPKSKVSSPKGRTED